MDMIYFKTIINDFITLYMKRYKLNDKGLAFGIWYLEFFEGLSQDQIEKAIVDGSGDNNIDALFIDEEKIAVCLQFKDQKDVNKAVKLEEISGFIGGIYILRDFLTKDNCGRSFNPKLHTNASEISQKAESGELNGYHFKFVISSNGSTSREVEERFDGLKTEFLEMGSEVECSILKLEDLFKKFQKKVFGPPIREIILEFEGRTKIIFERQGDEHIRILSGVVRGAELADKYEEHDETILMRNVRIELKDSEVNQLIRDTCSSPEGRHFLYFNNGVTFVTEKFNNSTGTRVKLANPQIVNGGQTIRILADAKRAGELNEDVLVQLRIIEIDDTYLSLKITQNLNNQNPIRPLDELGSSLVTLLLRRYLEACGYYLERRIDEYKILSPNQKKEICTRLNCTINELKSRRILLGNLYIVIQTVTEYKNMLYRIEPRGATEQLSDDYFAEVLIDLKIDPKSTEKILTSMDPSELLSSYNIFYSGITTYNSFSQRYLLPRSSNDNRLIQGLEFKEYEYRNLRQFHPLHVTGLIFLSSKDRLRSGGEINWEEELLNMYRKLYELSLRVPNSTPVRLIDLYIKNNDIKT